MEIEAQVAAREPQRDWRYAEVRLYEGSPLGLLGTTAVLFLVMLGLYAVAAAVDHRALIVGSKAGADIGQGLRRAGQEAAPSLKDAGRDLGRAANRAGEEIKESGQKAKDNARKDDNP